MPSRGAVAVMNGKKTLSDSEVLAYSKNRFVEYKLRRKVRQISDQEQVCHDKHQREIFRWRDFMRQSTKTSGVWAVSGDSEDEDWSEGEDNPDPNTDPPGDGARDESSPGKNGQRGNPSTELARSLAFQSDALSQLQKPWAYTYSAGSHNTVYREALELAHMKKRRLYLRRALSATASTDPLNGKYSFRNRSSEGDLSHDPGSGPGSSRPVTARSTPGTLRGKGQSETRDRSSAAVNKSRPKTSVGIVRVTHRQTQAAWQDKGEGTAVPSESPCVRVHGTRDVDVRGEQRGVRVCDGTSTNGEDNVTTTVLDITRSPGSAVAVVSEEHDDQRDKLPVLVRKQNGVTPHGKEAETGQEGQADMSSKTCLKKHENNVHLQSGEAEEGGTQHAQPLDTTSPQRQHRPSAKRVHIKLNGEQPHTDNRVSQSNGNNPETASAQSQYVKEETVGKEDAGVISARAVSTPDLPVQSESKAGQRLRSAIREVARRRGSDIRLRGSVSGERSEAATDTAQTPRYGSGALPRTLPSNLGRRRESFMNIADQLVALRSNNNRRLPRASADEAEEENHQSEAPCSPNEATVPQANGSVDDVKDSSKKSLPTPSSKVRATTGPKPNPITNQTQSKTNVNLDQPEVAPLVSKPAVDTTDSHPPRTPTPRPDKASDVTPDPAPTHPALDHPAEGDQDFDDWYPSDRSSYAGSDYTVHRGYKIRNYIRPQLRYRGDPFLSSRRERSLIRLSIEHPVYLSGNRGDLKSDMLFPKTCRQKVLQELVERNNQPVAVHDGGVLPPELRAKIDDFFKTIEPYCSKAEEEARD